MTRLPVNILLSLGLGLLAAACSNTNIVAKQQAWEEHLSYRQDPESWDLDMFEADMKLSDDPRVPKGDPMSLGIYPTPLDYSHAGSHIVSRNHPNYLGEGFVESSNNRIEYIAFTTYDGNAYAMVNLRLFDLRDGQTILIAPQRDGSLRSMQIGPRELESAQIDAYTDGLMARDDVREYFTAEGSIGRQQR